VRHRLPGGHRSDVFDCVTASGDEAVLKLTATPAEAEAEAAALRAWQGSGAAVRLLGAGGESGALLLERLRPATPLTSVDEPAAIGVAGELLRLLHAAERTAFRFPALEDAYLTYERRTLADADPAAAGVARLPAARAAAMRLCATAGRAVLLHGDFLDKNLLRNGASHVAIDPVPRVGDPCADAGFFAACRQPATGVWERAGALARRTGDDPARAVRWAAVWAVGEACETWRADSDDLEALMASRELARLLES
jgi:streptomycin 6-kinase